MTQFAQVGELAEQLRGVSYDKGDASPTRRPGYLPLLRAGNITDDGLVFDDLVFVPAARVSHKQKIRRNDVLIAASSGSLDVIGKAARALDDYEGGFGAFCKVLRPGRNVDPAYFAHFFRTREYRQTVSALAAGVNINNLRNADLDGILIPLPPLSEQRLIAEILDRADALRARRRAALAQLDALTQSIFLDMFGDPATNPMGWPTGTIGDLLESAAYGTSGKPRDSGEWPLLRMNNITSAGRIDLASLKYMELEDKELPRYLVRAGDVLFNRTNSPELVGKTAIFRGCRPMAYAGYLIRLRVSQRADPEYLAAFLNTKYAKRVLRSMCKSIIGMANINATELQSVRLPKPTLALQRNFARCLGAIEKLRISHQAALAGSDTLFVCLQHRAFRGEL
jgi:type I restriction enzyme S subunit